MRAFLFPGQGSQHVGMAVDLFRTDAAFRDLVKFASAQAGEDLGRICLHGPDKVLRRTSLLQPLLVAVSLGYLRHLTAHGLRPDAVLGHSLGEITALAASGVLTFEEAIRVAARRGALMEQAAGTVRGGMLAVATTQRDRVLELLAGMTGDPPVVLANDNAPTQLVLSGELDALTHIGRLLRRERLGRCQPLPVSGPWHSPFMATARDEFRVWAESLSFKRPQATLILNATGRAETDPERIKHHVTETLAGPVQWRTAMESLAAMRPRQILEIGPGRVLTGLARANGIDGATETVCVNDLRGVELVVSGQRAATQTDGGGK